MPERPDAVEMRSGLFAGSADGLSDVSSTGGRQSPALIHVPITDNAFAGWQPATQQT